MQRDATLDAWKTTTECPDSNVQHTANTHCSEGISQLHSVSVQLALVLVRLEPWKIFPKQHS